MTRHADGGASSTHGTNHRGRLWDRRRLKLARRWGGAEVRVVLGGMHGRVVRARRKRVTPVRVRVCRGRRGIGRSGPVPVPRSMTRCVPVPSELVHQSLLGRKCGLGLGIVGGVHGRRLQSLQGGKPLHGGRADSSRSGGCGVGLMGRRVRVGSGVGVMS